MTHLMREMLSANGARTEITVTLTWLDNPCTSNTTAPAPARRYSEIH
jgi:hypothetical protein